MLTLAVGPNIDCDDIFLSSLVDGLWFAAAVGANQAGDGGAGQPAPGVPGEPGLNCWDLNGDGVQDAEEDVNGDGVWDALDCQGVAGGSGAAGTDGEPGLNCWDLNGDGVQDAEEDVNGDGVWDALDCQGAGGTAGAPGAAGLDCWDLNGDGVADPEEDINGDGVWDALDCEGAEGAPGEDATGVIARGVIGADGALLSGNRVQYVEHPQLGVYFIGIELPEELLPGDPDGFGTLITIELNSIGGDDGLAALLFGYYEVESIVDNILRVQVQIRTITNALRNSDFTIAVIGP
jgi:hypothetical protein